MAVYNLIIVFHEPESPVLDYHRQAMLHPRTYSISKLSRVRNKTFLSFFFTPISSFNEQEGQFQVPLSEVKKQSTSSEHPAYEKPSVSEGSLGVHSGKDGRENPVSR